MQFKMPEALDGLSLAEIKDLRVAAHAEAAELNAIADDEITDEQVDDLIVLAGHLATLDGAIEAGESAAAERAEKLAAARGKVEEESSTPAPDEGDEEDDAPEDEEPEEESDDAEAREEKELVTASAGSRRSTVASARRNAPPAEPDPEMTPPSNVGVLIASANVPDFTAGTELEGMPELTRAFMARSRMLIGRKDKATMERYGVAKIQRPSSKFTISSKMSTAEQLAIIDEVAREKRLPGGSLTAAGGWCAPSDTLYDFCENETAVNLFSLPEVTVTHGGINFTPGPQLADLLADPNFGFIQTEAQAEAGTPKVCFEFECPDFTEIRLDAFGYCFKAPILTASPAGWPELIQRFLNLSTIAWQYKMAATKLSRVSTALGAAVVFAPIGGAVADTLDAVSLNAAIIRQEQFLGDTATIEATLPTWAREIFRSDLSRRNGVDKLAVTDAEIDSWFRTRHIATSYINGYQPLATTGAGAGTAWPATLEIMLYPAGTFVWGNNDVINVDSVYDSAGLEVNMYTAVFFEEAGMLINRCGKGKKVSIDISCLAGVTGAAELSCITTP